MTKVTFVVRTDEEYERMLAGNMVRIALTNEYRELNSNYKYAQIAIERLYAGDKKAAKIAELDSEFKKSEERIRNIKNLKAMRLAEKNFAKNILES